MPFTPWQHIEKRAHDEFGSTMPPGAELKKWLADLLNSKVDDPAILGLDNILAAGWKAYENLSEPEEIQRPAPGQPVPRAANQNPDAMPFANGH